MAAAGKENKEKKGNKDEASSMALRRITEELTALRTEIDALKSRSDPDVTVSEKITPPPDASGGPIRTSVPGRLQKLLRGDADAVVSINYAYRICDDDQNSIAASDEFSRQGLEEILSVDDTKVARLGYALSSAPKVAILRMLVNAGRQSAAQIGEKANLTTGSLYHHLRELTHAGVIESNVRNRFELTEIGRQTTLLLFAEAGRM